MQERNEGKAASKRLNATVVVGAIAVLLAAFVLVFAITAGTGTSPTSVAGDVAPVAAEQAATVASGQTTAQVVAAGSALAADTDAAVGEMIADEDTPLSAYPVENPLEGFTWLLLAGIVGAAAFFLLSTRRMNRDIARMRDSIR